MSKEAVHTPYNANLAQLRACLPFQASRGLLSRSKCPVSAGTQSAKMLPVLHLAKHSQICGEHVTFMQTVRQQKLDNYEYQELEPDQATQQDNLQFYI